MVIFHLSDNVGDKYRILHEKCGRMVFTHKLLTYQKSNEWAQRTSEISNTKHSDCVYKALSMWYCVYYIHTETLVIFACLFVSDLSKMLKFAATHREMTTKSKYQPKTFVNNYLWGCIRIWGNPRIKSNVNSLFWMHNWKWMNLSKLADLNICTLQLKWKTK